MGGRVWLNLVIAVALVGLAACGDDSVGGTNNNANLNNGADTNCGDGEVQGLEECDDGVDNSDTRSDACRTDCTLPSCGDGVVDADESCDAGSSNSDEVPDVCRTSCAVPRCGDGIVDVASGEGCDEGTALPTETCSDSCVVVYCGNGVLEDGEICDDGNFVPGDNCSPDCLSNETCGNGYVDAIRGEQCDDSGQSADCDDDCSVAVCGDGLVNLSAGEACDDSGETATCNIDCSVAECGDGLVNLSAGEECDDGGIAPGDTCGPSCLTERCGNGVVDPGEDCDVGDLSPGDGCSPVCLFEVCGNGFIDIAVFEECDDGNLASHDGCSSGCTVEQLEWSRIPKPLDIRVGHMMTWDVTRQRVVLFGGTDNTTMRNDTWEFDGSDWQRVHTAHSPPGRIMGRMIHDSLRGVCVLFGGLGPNGYLNDTWEFDGVDWTETSPASSPARRYEHSMTFDAARGETVLFGGGAGYNSFFEETWVYDGATWTQVANGVPYYPYGRMSSAMAYDAANQRVVLFGGVGSNAWLDMQDTYVWNGSAWSRISTGGPEKRREGQMIYDFQRGKVVLFGGNVRVGSVFHLDSDFWELTGSTWSQIPMGAQPSGRSRFGMAWDGIGQRTLVYGGRTDDGADGELWAFSGGTWAVQHIFEPPVEGHHQMVFDTARGVMVAHLGSFDFVGGQYLNHTWEYDGLRWTNVSTTAVPPIRDGFGMAYDQARQRVVLFGGYAGSTYRNDTWVYDGVNWTQQTFSGSVPPVGDCASLVYDSSRQVSVLYSRMVLGTWEYDGTSWTKVVSSPQPYPTQRRYTDMVYDAGRQRVVLHGGLVYGADGRAYGSDTWEYDGIGWTEIQTPTLPPGRGYHDLAYDSDRQRVVLFGGYTNAGTVTDSTWEYDGVDWTLVPTLTAPEGWAAGAMAYDPIWKQILRHNQAVYRYTYLSSWPEEACDAAIDQDLDGLSGCLDPDCDGRPCGGGGTCVAGVCQ